MPMNPATTIDDVIAHLDEIIRRSVETNDRRGYFAAAYRCITGCVRDALRNGQFQDNARMERLDVVFAGRYFDAYDRWERGEAPTEAWAKAFEATRRAGLPVMQHLILSGNAHITLDLGIAAAEVAPGPDIESLRVDFYRINDVLMTAASPVDGALVGITERWDPRLGHLLERLMRAAPREQQEVSSVLVDAWRDLAWRFATRLAALSAEARQELIAEQDREAGRIADAMLLGAPLERLLDGDDSLEIAENIRILARAEPSPRQDPGSLAGAHGPEVPTG